MRCAKYFKMAAHPDSWLMTEIYGDLGEGAKTDGFVRCLIGFHTLKANVEQTNPSDV